ncbi:MAG: bifunctional phosphopantothenoylcysteine decarboxylase/phosphopantothenate synthase [Candidatus Moranbacteria bacterium]|nr:bifunctional phosphopantothenoylcysteine decarboxylase/phosphopantothenate synthase [Candidatus Moranbacteria bacterium]
MKKVLVTAGSTRVPIDQVRAITNIFQGKTGHDIARYMAREGADVTLVTSNNDVVGVDRLRVLRYSTFDELADIMAMEITDGAYDAVVHSAAVSDYKVSGVFAKDDADRLVPLDSAKKVSSAHPNLYFELVPTEKLIDKIRADWGFEGMIVKFKLEVGKTYSELISIATASVRASKADLIIANNLEWYRSAALFITPDGMSVTVGRPELAGEIWKKINVTEKGK